MLFGYRLPSESVLLLFERPYLTASFRPWAENCRLLGRLLSSPVTNLRLPARRHPRRQMNLLGLAQINQDVVDPSVLDRAAHVSRKSCCA